jgi:hypothetical protein
MQRAVRLITKAYPRARVTSHRTDHGTQRWAATYFQAPGQEVAADALLFWSTAARAGDAARREGLATIARLTGRHTFEVPTFTTTEADLATTEQEHTS